jgi:hypothetical protein
MQIKYYKDYKTQKNNAFCKMAAGHAVLLQQLTRRLAWIGQLSQSRNQLDQDTWAKFNTPLNIFGRSSKNLCANTALNALSGAVEKLLVGDLSEKQIDNIVPVLTLLNQYYPDLWENIEFVDIEQPVSTAAFGNGLFVQEA